MKIHALCLVKNEADILRETLASAVHWCDHIYVFDNGSHDGTWDLVKDIAKQHPKIIPHKHDAVVFSDGLRADLFNAFRSIADIQDWWCRLDADEFYIDNPRVFLTKIPRHFQTVWSASFNYYFTDADAVSYHQNPVKFLETPIQQRLRHYMNNWGELRFFRHSHDIVWNRAEDCGGFPAAMFSAPAYPVRIWLKHYQYRSPQQIEQRLSTRRPAMEGSHFLHEMTPSWSSAVATKRDAPLVFKDARLEFAGACWKERIVPAVSLEFDGLDRRFVVNEGLMPEFPIRLRYSRFKTMIPHSIRAFLGQLRHQTVGLREIPAAVLGRVRMWRIRRTPHLTGTLSREPSLEA